MTIFGFGPRIVLSIPNLQVSVGDAPILRGLSLDVPSGEVHAIMGPNGDLLGRGA